MERYAVIGAGPMGLACAYELVKRGFPVDIYEADDRLGGMSAHFDFNGLSIERYYHFICKHDYPMFELLAELGLSEKLVWKDTTMGYYFAGQHYQWGNPFALLKFTPLSLFGRLRYGFHMFYCTRLKNWRKIDQLEASAWIKGWIGDKAYSVLWQRLFELKFHKYADNLSASWIWARIRRVGQSRKSLFQETMGFLQGGSKTLLDALGDAIQNSGGKIFLNTPVTEILCEENKLIGLRRKDGVEKHYDRVISTVPLPFVPRLMKSLPEKHREVFESINNIGVVCLIFKLKKAITSHFWLNISDERIEIPGIIEMSNLQPFDQNIVYVPFYLPQDHPKYTRPDEAFIDESITYFKHLNPEFVDSDIIDVNVSRYGFAQPICPPAFIDGLPPIETEIEGLYVMDTSYYYPEDRSISESVKLGREFIGKLLG